MRNTADRIRQAISFEVLGLVIVTPLFAWIFDRSLGEMGGLTVLGATAATLWNYLFNLGFDRVLQKTRGGDAHKTLPLRIAHAVLFEVTLLAFLFPLFAWWLDISLVAAFGMEISFAAFYMTYTFVFTWGYDTVFPPQRSEWRPA